MCNRYFILTITVHIACSVQSKYIPSMINQSELILHRYVRYSSCLHQMINIYMVSRLLQAHIHVWYRSVNRHITFSSCFFSPVRTCVVIPRLLSSPLSLRAVTVYRVPATRDSNFTIRSSSFSLITVVERWSSMEKM